MRLAEQLSRDINDAYETAELGLPPGAVIDYDGFVRGFVAGAVAAATKLGVGDRRRKAEPGIRERKRGRRENVIPIAEGRGVLPGRGT